MVGGLSGVQRWCAVVVFGVLMALTGWLVVGSADSQAVAVRGAVPDARVVALPCSGTSGSFVTIPTGARVVSVADIQVCATGRLTVTFSGDRAAGCATHGLCAYHGTETWNAQGAGDLQLLTVVRHGHRSTIMTLAVGGFGPSVLSSVTRGRDGAGVCRDRDSPEAESMSSAVRHGRVEVRLGAPGLASLGTRCAGPLIVDVASVLAHRTVSLARLRRAHTRIDLGELARVSAGGFSGTVDSTVVLRLGRSQARPVPKPVADRVATARYRITHLAGAATAAVRASGRPACAPLDACGLHGTIFLTPRPSNRDTLSLQAAGPHNRSRLDLLTALGVRTGGHSAGINIFGSGVLGAEFTTRTSLTQNRRSCINRMPAERMQITIEKQRARLRIEATPFDLTGNDPLHSRCPGPRLKLEAFSSTSLPPGILRRRQFQIRLHGISFRDGPYDVTTHSTLIATLRRTAVTTRPISNQAARRGGLTHSHSRRIGAA